LVIHVFYTNLKVFDVEQTKHMVGMDGLVSTCATQRMASQQSLKKIETAVSAANKMCTKIACDNNNNIFEETFDHCLMENNLIGSHI